MDIQEQISIVACLINSVKEHIKVIRSAGVDNLKQAENYLNSLQRTDEMLKNLLNIETGDRK